MATFEEMMEQFRNPGDAGLAETFAADLETVYRDDLSIRDAAVAAREATIAERESDIVARDAEVIRLKAVNYDLLVAAPKPGGPDNDNEPDVDTEKSGIDSLFE